MTQSQPLARDSIKRLAKSTGKSTASKAVQRIDEQAANFEARNTVQTGDAELFRMYALRALRTEINVIIGPDNDSKES